MGDRLAPDQGMTELIARMTTAPPGYAAEPELDMGGPGVEVGAGVLAGLAVSLGSVARELRRANDRAAKKWANVHPLKIPPVGAQVVNGAVTVQDPERWGPRQGWAWDIRRLTVGGLIQSGGTQVASEGSVTSPAANTQIAQITVGNLAPGSYMIGWAVELDGTPGAGDVDNFQLRSGTTTLLTAINDGAVGRYPQSAYGPVTIPTGNTNAISVRSIGAGTAGAIYSAQISLTPVADDQVTMYLNAAVDVNEEHEFTASAPEWNLGKAGLLLMPNDWMVITGAGLGAAEVIMNGAGIEIALDYLPDYLL